MWNTFVFVFVFVFAATCCAGCTPRTHAIDATACLLLLVCLQAAPNLVLEAVYDTFDLLGGEATGEVKGKAGGEVKGKGGRGGDPTSAFDPKAAGPVDLTARITRTCTSTDQVTGTPTTRQTVIVL